MCMNPKLLTFTKNHMIRLIKKSMETTWQWCHGRSLGRVQIELEMRKHAEWKCDCWWDGTEAAAQCLRVTHTGWVLHFQYLYIRHALLWKVMLKGQWAQSDVKPAHEATGSHAFAHDFVAWVVFQCVMFQNVSVLKISWLHLYSVENEMLPEFVL